jgi:hypothetical protein
MVAKAIPIGLKFLIIGLIFFSFLRVVSRFFV